MKDDRVVVIGCVGLGDVHHPDAVRADCEKCNTWIVYDPRSVEYAKRKHPDLRVALICLGCAGHWMSKRSDAELECGKNLARSVPDIGDRVDLIGNDELRAYLRSKSSQ